MKDLQWVTLQWRKKEDEKKRLGEYGNVGIWESWSLEVDPLARSEKQLGKEPPPNKVAFRMLCSLYKHIGLLLSDQFLCQLLGPVYFEFSRVYDH
jgi:hypothetical protein